MCATFTDDDVGKHVENEHGDEIGIVTAIEETDVAYVEPDPEVTDSIKAALGWESESDVAVLQAESVLEITDEAVRLEGGEASLDRGRGDPSDTIGGDDGVIDPDDEPSRGGRSRDAGTDEGDTGGVDPTETMGGAEEMDPTDSIGGVDEMDGAESIDDPDRGIDVDPSDAVERDPRSDERADDADRDTGLEGWVDETDESKGASGRADTEVDAGGVRDAETDRGGPMTEDATRTELESESSSNEADESDVDDDRTD